MTEHETAGDQGFSLIELLLVITIVGILATIVVFSVVGFRDDAHDSACPADWRNLNTSVESYFTQYDTTTIPTDGSPEGFEKTIVNAGVMREVSKFYDLDATGAITPVAGSPCTL